MPSYRLYIMTADGHIRSRHDEEADDLDLVLLAAARLGGGARDVEVWDGASFIGCVLKDGSFHRQKKPGV